MPEWLGLALCLFVIAYSASVGVVSRRTVRAFAMSAGRPRWEADERLAARLLAQTKTASKAGLALLAAAVVCGLAVPALHDSDAWNIALYSAMLLGFAAGPVVESVRRAVAPRAADALRAARVSEASVHDHVPPLERIAAALAALLPGVLACAGAVASSVGLVDGEAVAWWPAAVIAVVALLAPIGAEVTARRLVDAPRQAGSADELAMEDALRAQSVRRLLWTAGTIAVAATAVVLILVDAGVSGGYPANPAAGAVSGLVGVLMLAMAGFAGMAMFATPGRRFLKRLWPVGGDR